MEPINATAGNTATVAEGGKKGIPGSTLKIFAIVTMFIDHFGAVILESYMKQFPNDPAELAAMENVNQTSLLIVSFVDMLFRCIGRMAFPIFIFLLVEGFMHTHNRAKYAFRLFLFALISEIPFNLALTGHAFSKPFSGVTFGYQSVFWTLLLGFLFMCYAEFIKTKKLPDIAYVGTCILSVGLCALASYKGVFFMGQLASFAGVDNEKVATILNVTVPTVALVVFLIILCIKKGKEEMFKISSVLVGLFVLMLAAAYGNTDYNMWGVLAIAFAYFFKENKTNCMLATVIVLTVMNIIEAFAFFDLILIKRYNGERGLKIKYFFYAFYPVHLFLFYTISWLLGHQPGGFLGF